MKKGYLVINTILVFIVVFGVSSTIINSLNSLPTIIEAYGVYWDGDIVLCPPNEIREEVEWAVKRWNDAILYFSLRYFMIDILKTKITVAEDPGKCNVRFGFYDHPLSFEHFPEEVCVEGDLENLENLIVGYVEFPHIIELDQPAVINNATIYLWKGLKDRHLKAVVLHEIAVLLGLGQPRYSRTPPMRSASDLWGSLHVTSIDTYALYLKNRSPEVGRIISPTPPILPYITVELGIYYDIISFSSASLTSLLFYKTYSRRR